MSLVINNAFQMKANQLENLIRDLCEVKEKLFNETVLELEGMGFKNEQEVDEFFSKDFTGEWGWFKGSVMIYFYKGKVIIQFFNTHLSHELTKQLTKKYKMKPYHFQNNSDPEKVRNWKEREEFWNSLSNDFGTSFSDKGLQYKFISNDDIYNLKLKSGIIFLDKPESYIKLVLRDFFKGLKKIYG